MVLSEGLFFDYLSDRFMKSAQLRIAEGCGGECSFCTRPLLEGTEVRFTPQSELKKEFQQIWEQGITHLDFLDCTLLQQADGLIQVLKELEQEGMGFAFSLAAPVKLLIRNQKHLMPLKKLGLRQVTLGVINSNRDMLDHYGMKMTEADQHYAIQILQALRIQIHLRYMMFEPETRLEHLFADYRFLEKNHLLGLVPFTDILASYPDLDEDSPFVERCHAAGLYLPAENPLLPYRPLDATAEEVFRWVIFFEWEYGVRWSQFYQLLLELRADLAKNKPGWALANSGQELLYITLNLRMMPYELFKALLTAADNGKLTAVSEIEVRRQVEHRFFEFEEQYWAFRKNNNL